MIKSSGESILSFDESFISKIIINLHINTIYAILFFGSLGKYEKNINNH
jgi:hypothetical protein